jgi:hypothetical protein
MATAFCLATAYRLWLLPSVLETAETGLGKKNKERQHLFT